MADFSSTEKINAAWKHLLGILGTSNGAIGSGKSWFEEAFSATHIIGPDDIWIDSIPAAANITAARAAPANVVEDRSDGAAITLSANGSNWNITSTFAPKVGFQVTNVHPNPTYIKSITNVVSNGGNSYTITLNSNTGVSAGSAVLHRRIYLTTDPTTNGLAWFARAKYGDSFSNLIQDFVQSTKYGKGYTVRLFQANGTEILTTDGAWVFNWQKGMLLFASGYTPTNLSYAQPVYIEAFRYVGGKGLGNGPTVVSGVLNDTLRFDGLNYVPTSSVKSDGTDLYVQNKLTVSGSIVVPSGIAPVPSGVGDIGEIRWDNNFLYIKTAAGWARTNLNYY